MYFGLIIVHFIVTLIFAWLYTNKRFGYQEKKLLFLLVVCYCLLNAFKPIDVVPDASSYYERYYSALDSLSLEDFSRVNVFSKVRHYSMSFGSSLISYLFASSGVSYSSFSFVITFAETIIMLAYCSKIADYFRVSRNSSLVFLEMMVLIGYNYQFIAFAQGIVMCIIIPAFYYFVRRKYAMALLLVIFSMLFHLVGIVGLAVMLIYQLSPTLKRKTYKWTWLLSGILIITNSGYYLSSIATYISEVVLKVAIKYNPLYIKYYEYNMSGKVSLINVVFWLFTGALLFSNDERVYYWKTVNLSLTAVILMAIFPSWSIMHRVYDVFLSFLIIAGMLFVGGARSNLRVKNSEIGMTYIFIVLKFLSAMRILIR